MTMIDMLYMNKEIAYEARMQNPNIILSESLIAVLRVYYKKPKDILILLISLKAYLMV